MELHATKPYPMLAFRNRRPTTGQRFRWPRLAPASRHSARRGQPSDSLPEGIRKRAAGFLIHRLSIAGQLAKLRQIVRSQPAAFDRTGCFGDATGKRAAHSIDAGSRRAVAELLDCASE